MPDLGRYAAEVLLSYGGSLLLLGAITGLSWARYRRLKAEMDRVERDRNA